MGMMKYERLGTEGWQNWPGGKKGRLMIRPLLCSVEAKLRGPIPGLTQARQWVLSGVFREDTEVGSLQTSLESRGHLQPG